MFYHDEIIEPLLKCPGCNKKYDEAKLLPCGIYCTKCLIETLDNNIEKFQCKFCDDIHSIPETNFKNFKTLENFISKKPFVKLDDFSRGQSADDLKAHLKEIEESLNQFKLEIEKSLETVHDFYLNLRTEIQLETEVLIERIKDISESMIKEVQDKEKASLVYSNETNLLRFKNIAFQMESFHAEWTKYLKNHDIKETETNRANLEAVQLKNDLLNQKKFLNSLIFGNNKYEFIKHDSEINEIVIGRIKWEPILDLDIWFKAFKKHITDSYQNF